MLAVASLTPAAPRVCLLLQPSHCTRVQAEWEKLNWQTVAQLRESCARHGLPTTGVKPELVGRLARLLVCT